MNRSGLLVLAAVALALAAAGVLASSNFLGFDLPFMRVSERELVTRMTENAVLGGGYALTFSGPNSPNWKVAPGHQLEKFSVESGDAAFARLTSSTPFNGHSVDWPNLGLSITLPIEFNNQTSGQMIEVGILARLTAVKSTDAILVIYATQQAGNSGWQTLRLTRNFEMHKFVFKVPKLEGAYIAQPILVIHADATGRGRMADILGAYVKRYTPEPAGQ